MDVKKPNPLNTEKQIKLTIIETKKDVSIMVFVFVDIFTNVNCNLKGRTHFKP